MRELLEKWARLEPGEIEHDQWLDEIANKTCDEFRINGIAVFSDLLRFGEFNPALIQWAVQQAIIARRWGFEMTFNTDWREKGAEVEAMIRYGVNWTSSELASNPAEALLEAYLKALEEVLR